jgi:NAD+ synthetase
VQGLTKRLQATQTQKIVIGVSGGLDSTQALIVSTRAMDRLALPRSNVLAYTLPGFATSESTKASAWALMRALGVSAQEIDIRPAARRMLADLGHPFSRGEEVYDVTFENVQAGLRTDYLFRLANHNGALVCGTGDLSELGLGWCTYGVGDHAYNLGNFLRTLATPEPIMGWSLTSLKEKLFKICAKVVSHGRYVASQMAEVAIPRQMFQEILRLIAELRPQPPPAPA